MSAIATIEELESLYYPSREGYRKKADVYAQSTTTGYYNAIYGAMAWANLNLEANLFSALPKYPWERSGVRVITSRPTITTTNSNTKLGGTAESGAIMETAIPGVVEFSILPKIAQLAFGASTVFEWLANNSKDDTYGGMEALRPYMAVQHAEYINQMLFADVEKEAADGAAAYAGTKDWESIDRGLSSSVEELALGGTYDNYYNLYDKLDRDGATATTYDTTVESAGTGIGVNGSITKAAILKVMRNARKAGNNEVSFMITGHEVYSELQELYEPQVRYPTGMGESIISVDVNGVQTFDGRGVGIHVSTLYGKPLIISKDASNNSGDDNEVGRLFGIDTSDKEGFGAPRCGIRLARPTVYNEAGEGNPAWPFVNDKFAERGVYWTMGELSLSRFVGHFKLRDISV